jgi:hypothetical protein
MNQDDRRMRNSRSQQSPWGNLRSAGFVATALGSVGVLGLIVTGGMLSVSTIPTRAPLMFWGLFGISTALWIAGSLMLVVIRARLRR